MSDLEISEPLIPPRAKEGFPSTHLPSKNKAFIAITEEEEEENRKGHVYTLSKEYTERRREGRGKFFPGLPRLRFA